MIGRAIFSAVILLLIAGRGVDAHINQTGMARLEIDGATIQYSLTLILAELPDELRASFAAAADGDRAAAEKLAEAAKRMISVSRGGQPCQHGRFSIQGSQGNDGWVVLRLQLQCPSSAGPVHLREDWVQLLGEHYRTIVAYAGAGGDKPEGQVILGEGKNEATIDATASRPSAFGEFLWLGIEHILGGYDHLLFLLALLVTAGGFWLTIKIVTAFTLAHTVTLSVAAFGWVQIPSAIIEPLIAASILWVAIENLVLAQAAVRRWLLAFAFGLIHGFGFAGALAELELARPALLNALLGFNLGVELGQFACVAVVLPPLGWALRRWPRLRLAQATSLAVAGIALFWLAERLLAG